jgi:undecaprenyl-diphosphatase
MEYILKYFLLGIIEGLTEFLPVSSTAHLILFSYLLNLQQSDFHKFFEIFIQTGAILAVIVSYWKLLIRNKNLFFYLILSFIPTAIISLFFYKTIKSVFFEDQILITSMLIIVGFLFILIEYFVKKNKLNLKYSLEQLNPIKAILIGIFQSLAIIPGVSRAGAVILGMMLLRFTRKDSVIYSFLLAVPTIISAGLYDLYKSGFNAILFNDNLYYLIIGFLTSFIFALLAIKFFLNYLQKHDLTIFGIYRIILGIIFILPLL